MNSKKNRVEILAPAGDLETLKLAINAGADAIYLGLNNFGARAFAKNFSYEEYEEAIAYAHLRNVKIYVTMNTLLNEDEISNAIKQVDYLYEHQVDALIIQDLGLLNIVSQKYPDLELHASTQMHIHNRSGIKFLKDKGIKRVVLARETPLAVIEECQKENIDIEIFAYGALCVSYSGQCLMSSCLKNRSGNKGMCAQNCRMIYDVKDQNNKLLSSNKYLLSTSDLNIINDLPKLLDLNICSLKIEGRMKRSEYVAKVVSIFKEAVDAYYDNKAYKLSDKQLEELKVLFNRGFTSGLIFDQNGKDFFNQYRPNHMGIEIGKVIKYHNKRVYIKLSKDLNQNDGIRIVGKKDIGLNCNFIYLNNLLVNHADKGSIIALEVNDYIENNAMVVKTTDYILNNQIKNEFGTYKKRFNIKMYFEAKVDKPLKLIIEHKNYHIEVTSEMLCQQAINKPTDKDRIISQLSKINDTIYKIESIDGICDEIFISIKTINDLRKKALTLLDEKRLDIYPSRKAKEYKPLSNNEYHTKQIFVQIQNESQYQSLKDKNYLLFTNVSSLLKKYSDLNVLQYVVNENSEYHDSKYSIISEIGGLQCKSELIANTTLNVTNSYALEFLLHYGAYCVILSNELDEHMIQKIIDAYMMRHNFKPNVAICSYGKIDLMHIKADFLFDKAFKNVSYKDVTLNDFQNNHIKIYEDDMHIKHLYNVIPREFKSDLVSNYFIKLTDEENSYEKVFRGF